MEAKDLMVINGGNGESSEILGKFLYYSFPRLIINRKAFLELVKRYGFTSSVRDKHSPIDAFRSATSDVTELSKNKTVKRISHEFISEIINA